MVLALPGMYLFYKYSQYKRQQQEQNRRKVTERELAHLNHKIVSLTYSTCTTVGGCSCKIMFVRSALANRSVETGYHVNVIVSDIS